MQKRNVKILFIIIVLVIAVTILSVFILSRKKADNSNMQVGTIYHTYPAKLLVTDSGKAASITADKSSAYLYWASWCPDCEAILPDVDTIAAGIRQNDCTFSLVNRLEPDRESVDAATKAISYNGVSEQTLFDKKRVAYDSIGLTMIPTLFITDANNIVTSVSRGSIPDALTITSMINEANAGKSDALYNIISSCKGSDRLYQIYDHSSDLAITDSFIADLILSYGSDRERSLLDDRLPDNYIPFSDNTNNEQNIQKLSSFYLKEIKASNDKKAYSDILEIIKTGYISDTVPLFYTEYSSDMASYKKSDLDTIQELSIMLSLSSVGELNDRSYSWLKEKVSSGTLWNSYDLYGDAVSGTASCPEAERYALAALIAISEKDSDTASIAIEKMEAGKSYSNGSDTEYMISDTRTGKFDPFTQYLALYVYESYEQQEL